MKWVFGPRYKHHSDAHKFIGKLNEFDIYVAPLREDVIFIRFGSGMGDYKSCYPKAYPQDELLMKIHEIYERWKKKNG